MAVVESSQRRLAWIRAAPVRPPGAHRGRRRRPSPAGIGDGHGDARSPGLPFFDARDDVSSLVLLAAGPLLAAWLVMVRGVGGYSREVFGAGTEEYKRIIRASMLCAGLVGIGCYLTSFPLSRGFFLLAFAIGTPLLVLGRLALRRVIHRTRVARPPARAADHRRGPGSRRRGGGRAAPRVSGWATPCWVRSPRRACRRPETVAGIPVLGHTDAAAAVVADLAAEVILFTEGAFGTSQELRRATWELEGLPVQSHRRPEPDRCLEPPPEGSSRRRSAARPSRVLSLPPRLAVGEARLRRPRGRVPPWSCSSGDGCSPRWPSRRTMEDRCCSGRSASAATGSPSTA